MSYIHHLENAAFDWENASPIGCGSAGAMIYGCVGMERLSLNEESIWAGGPMDTKYEGFAEKIEHIRQLLKKGKDYEAGRWIEENMQDAYCFINSYEYAGEIHVKIHDDDTCVEYRRDIDLINGICTVSYKKEDVAYKREYFAFYPQKLICARYTAELPFDAEISFCRENIVLQKAYEGGYVCRRLYSCW